MKTLQEKLDAVALELEPVLWDLLNEIEENKLLVILIAMIVFGFLYSF